MSDKKLFPRPYVLNLAYMALDALWSEGIFCAISGELRRGESKVSGIVLVAMAFADTALGYVRSRGKEYGVDCQIIVKNSKGSDNRKQQRFTLHDVPGIVYSAEPANFGSMLIATTGNRLFNILLRKRAKELGYKLSQYGLYHNDEVIAGCEERQIFKVLSLPFISPLGRGYAIGDRLG